MFQVETIDQFKPLSRNIQLLVAAPSLANFLKKVTQDHQVKSQVVMKILLLHVQTIPLQKLQLILTIFLHYQA